jgi:hypothetical protein
MTTTLFGKDPWNSIGYVDSDGNAYTSGSWSSVGYVDKDGGVYRPGSLFSDNRVGHVDGPDINAGAAALLLLFDISEDEEKEALDNRLPTEESPYQQEAEYEPDYGHYDRPSHSGYSSSSYPAQSSDSLAEAESKIISTLVVIDLFLIIGGLFLGATASVVIGIFIHIVPLTIQYYTNFDLLGLILPEKIKSRVENEVLRMTVYWFMTALIVGLFVYIEVNFF